MAALLLASANPILFTAQGRIRIRNKKKCPLTLEGVASSSRPSKFSNTAAQKPRKDTRGQHNVKKILSIQLAATSLVTGSSQSWPPQPRRSPSMKLPSPVSARWKELWCNKCPSQQRGVKTKKKTDSDSDSTSNDAVWVPKTGSRPPLLQAKWQQCQIPPSPISSLTY